MDKRDNEPKGTAATASKMAVGKKDVGGESPSPGQGATSSQNQGGTQNQGATGTKNQSASITPQQNHGAVGSQPNPGGATGSQQNKIRAHKDKAPVARVSCNKPNKQPTKL